MPKPGRAKFQKILALEKDFQPDPKLIKKILDFLKQHAANNADPELGECAYEYARAVGLFAHSKDPQIGDMHINAELDHEQKMQPIRELRELAQRMAELLKHPNIKKNVLLGKDSFAESVGSIRRISELAEASRDRSHARFLPSEEKQDGDPKRARYRLYQTLAGCWYVCNPGCEVPARQRESGGPFADFAEGLLKLSPDTERNVSTDELHRGIWGIIKRQKNDPGPAFGATIL